jgi:translocation and assembly module TamB
LEATIKGKFHDLQLNEYSADNLQINADYYLGDVTGKVLLRSKVADIDLHLDILNVKNNPLYDGELSIHHLNLGELLLSDSIKSDLNFKLYLQGENFLPPGNHLSIRSEWGPSHFNQINIDTLFTEIYLNGTQYILDSLHFKTPAGLFSGRGQGDLTSNHLINYYYQLANLERVATLIGADSIEAHGILSGVAFGNADSLQTDMKFDLHQITYNEFYIDSLSGKSKAIILDSDPTIGIDMIATNLKLGAVKMDSLELSSLYDLDRISSDIKIQFDTNLRSSLRTVIQLDSIIKLSVPKINFEFIDDYWAGKLDKIVYDPDVNDIHISGVNIECTNSEDKRRIIAEGKLSSTGSEEFKLNIEGVHPKNILSYLGMDSRIDGRINLNLDLAGTADKPVFKGNLRFEEGNVGSISYQGIDSWFDYDDDRFNFDFSLDFNGEDSLMAEGHLPLHLSLTDTLDIFDDQKSISLDIKSEAIPVGLFLQNLKLFPETSGILLCDFTLKNTLADPNIQGYLHLRDGLLKSPYWGIDYKDINFKISALDDKFSLKEFQIISSDGNLNASGEIQLDYKESDDKVIYSNMNVLANNFFLLKHKDFEILISADIKYQMEKGKPIIGGYVDLIRSSFYLPTVMDRAGYVTDSAEEIKPVLIEAREKKIALNNPQKEKVSVQVQRDTIEVPGFLDLLEGELELRINRNTWVRNQQLRVEFGGNIKMIVDKGKYSLRGPVDIVRGQYDLFGRRFTVIQGKIDFLGGETINPPIYLEAEYVYRTVGREKRSLVIKVTGNLEYPIITFLENNNQISQDDAISIVLYGRKKDELSFGTQSDVAEMDGSTAAMGIVSNIVSDRLTRSVGDDLRLDVIEVNATDNWQNANFVVGKYITQNIFVTYKREFGQNLDNNLYPETISMEYEIRKNLFLQMIQGSPQDSGYDLLFRFDWD